MTDKNRGKKHDAHFDVTYWTAEAILTHPDFSRARLKYLEEILGLYGGDAFLGRLLMVAARMVVFAIAICLDAAYREDDRSTWPTVGNLKKALGHFGLASPRHIEQVLSRLVHTGYLESTTSPLDGRARILRPTPKMLAHDQEWLIAHYSPLAVLFGEADYALPLSRDARFQRVQRRIATGFFPPSAAVLLRNPGVMLFLSREAGILILSQLAKNAIDQRSCTIPLSLSNLSQRFAVSRAHVRNLLADASAQGFLDLDPQGRSLTLRPLIFGCLDRFIADSMSNHDLTGAAATRSIVDSGPSG